MYPFLFIFLFSAIIMIISYYFNASLYKKVKKCKFCKNKNVIIFEVEKLSTKDVVHIYCENCNKSYKSGYIKK